MTDRIQALRLAGGVPCDPRTAARWIAGEYIRGDILRERIGETASRLGIKRSRAPEIADAAPLEKDAWTLANERQDQLNGRLDDAYYAGDSLTARLRRENAATAAHEAAAQDARAPKSDSPQAA